MSPSSPATRFEGLQTRLLWAKRHHYAAGEQHFSDHVPVYALWLVQGGQLEIQTDTATWKVEAGQVFLGIPCRQRLVVARQDSSWLSVGLRVATMQGVDIMQQEAAHTLCPEPAARDQLETLLASLVAIAEAPEPGHEMMRDGLALALAGWYFATTKPGETGWLPGSQYYPAWLQATLARIEAQPDVSVETLAGLAHFSTAQFRRLFAKHLGIAPRAYLSQRRLEVARLWLETSDMPLAQVAARAGWVSAAHFSRAFKAHFGVAPLEWRRAARTLL